MVMSVCLALDRLSVVTPGITGLRNLLYSVSGVFQ